LLARDDRVAPDIESCPIGPIVRHGFEVLSDELRDRLVDLVDLTDGVRSET
jgi:hypothetical protein